VIRQIKVFDYPDEYMEINLNHIGRLIQPMYFVGGERHEAEYKKLLAELGGDDSYYRALAYILGFLGPKTYGSYMKYRYGGGKVSARSAWGKYSHGEQLLIKLAMELYESRQHGFNLVDAINVMDTDFFEVMLNGILIRRDLMK